MGLSFNLTQHRNAVLRAIHPLRCRLNTKLAVYTLRHQARALMTLAWNLMALSVCNLIPDTINFLEPDSLSLTRQAYSLSRHSHS